MKCNIFLSFLRYMLMAFLFFCDSGQQEGAATFDTAPIALKVLRCNNYQKYRNSCKLFPNRRCVQEKTFLVSFLATWGKDCASVNVLFCCQTRGKQREKGQCHILVWSTPERVESRQVRKQSAQIWLSFSSVAVACRTDGVWASRRAMLVQEKPKSM